MAIVYHNQHYVNRDGIIDEMALFIRQNDNRSQLQEKLAAELQERAKQKAQKADLPDGVTDSAYIKDTKQTTSLAWLWILIILSVLGLVLWLVIATTGK
ncbi:hypothetical protein EPN95_03410 [Patescibacteria group bacterium]|nr:MAG: hypothetical protein EPN95_03410 [Patescibacteria group bacterium]